MNLGKTVVTLTYRPRAQQNGDVIIEFSLDSTTVFRRTPPTEFTSPPLKHVGHVLPQLEAHIDMA
jgi:hypothetical protein